MPELPEVETIRRGLDSRVVGRGIHSVRVHHPRAVRRHQAGAADFVGRLTGATITRVDRRGKYLWCVLDTDEALLCHLGMSGQLLIRRTGTAPENHLRVGLTLDGDEPRELRFVDQRTFGHLLVDSLIPASEETDPDMVPAVVAHIARDLLDPRGDPGQVADRLRRRRTGIKRALLDQTLVSGIGNIYADESLWLARLHYDRRTDLLPARRIREVLDAVRTVLLAALAEGGTSFDGLYVDVDGHGGYFDRSLRAYGRAGQPCPRCSTAIVREPFMNRSAFRCPRCQPRPRSGQ
jgi:formamidopyrimidine-DNA glycosylase